MNEGILFEHEYYPLAMAAKKIGCTEDELILLAAQDKLNVCVLMPQNKAVTKFFADIDKGYRELPSCFSSLCKVPALTFKNYLADNLTPLDIVKACEEDGVYFRLKDDAPLKNMTLVVMAADVNKWIEKVTTQQALASALAEEVHNGEPINWGDWGQLTNITPVQAARLTHHIDPVAHPDIRTYGKNEKTGCTYVFAGPRVLGQAVALLIRPVYL